ncbi:axin [Hetaerina americana]|uniref:axin n=1 Tax=Hetaerina americana TaxID=62018 RepID=UPI003A7F6277
MSNIRSPREPCTGGSSSIELRDEHGARMVAHADDETFHRNSPRPPVPGEENESRCLGMESIDIGEGYESPTAKEWASKHCKPSHGLAIGSPCHTPCHRASSSSPFMPTHRLAAAVTDTAHPDEASQVLDPENSGPRSASSSSNSLPDSSGTPPYLRWARNLRSLLEDPDGVELFRRYLEGERCADTLSFWFACEGLKKQPNDDPGRLAQLIKVIHRKFFPRAVLAVPEEMRREVARRVRESTTSSTAPATSATSPLTPPDATITVVTPPLPPLPSNRPDCHVFDSVQREVERHINETTYPNFLRSELYLNHVQCMQSGVGSGGPGGTIPGGGGGGSGSSSGGSCGGGEEGALGGPVVTGPLPTLHEDSELVTGGDSVQCSAPGGAPSSQLDPLLPLTRDMLLVTQNSRAMELRPKPEAYAGLYLRQQGMLPSPYYHLNLASPTPTPSHHSRHHRFHPHASHIPAHLLQPTAPHPHLQYSSYNPVSRQDSELQSLSSDAHTDDTMSLTDSSVDGMSIGGGHHRLSKKQYIRHCKQIKESANLNRDPCMHHTVIPRTQRIQKEQVHPMKPEEFAAILIEKLETVKRKQEAQEKLDRKLQEGEGASGAEDSCGVMEGCIGGFGGGTMAVASPRTLADAIREKLQLTTDDSDQAILDQHVSRVWSDLTPSRSPGALSSPRPRSPDGSGRKRGTVSAMPGSLLASSAVSSHCSAAGLTSVPTGSGSGVSLLPPHPYQARPSYCPRHSRKEKDVFSTFSSDSGNVHDFPSDAGGGGSLGAIGPPSELSLGMPGMGRQQQQTSLQPHHYLPKSKSMPDYGDAQKGQDLLYSPVPGVHDGRFTRPGKEVDRRRSSSSKKTLTELTDSGVSVVSDTPTSTLHAPSTSTHSKERVLSWLLESEKQSSCGGSGGGGGGSHSHVSDRDSSSKHRMRSSTCATSPISSRRGKKSVVVYNSSSRSGSLERASGSGAVAQNTGLCSSGVSGGGWGGGHSPAQPFVADPCMPPLPLPHTPTQLEEARRRLEDDFRPRNNAGGSTSVPQVPLTRQRFSSSGKGGHVENVMGSASGTAITSVSNPSTLRKGRNTSRGSGGGVGPPPPSGEGSAGPEYTTVVFSFCDEQFPYRTKIPGRQLTLKHFKEYLPKKGSYRYFFKTECEDLDMKVIQEEIMDDNEILPLWEGKVMAQVKPID